MRISITIIFIIALHGILYSTIRIYSLFIFFFVFILHYFLSLVINKLAITHIYRYLAFYYVYGTDMK